LFCVFSRHSVISVTSQHRCFLTSLPVLWSCSVTKASSSVCYREDSCRNNALVLYLGHWLLEDFHSFMLVLDKDVGIISRLGQGTSFLSALYSEILTVSCNNHWKKRWDWRRVVWFCRLEPMPDIFPLYVEVTTFTPPLHTHPQRAPAEQFFLETCVVSESFNLSGTRYGPTTMAVTTTAQMLTIGRSWYTHSRQVWRFAYVKMSLLGVKNKHSSVERAPYFYRLFRKRSSPAGCWWRHSKHCSRMWHLSG
jgi:hypothetical protein